MVTAGPFPYGTHCLVSSDVLKCTTHTHVHTSISMTQHNTTSKPSDEDMIHVALRKYGRKGFLFNDYFPRALT